VVAQTKNFIVGLALGLAPAFFSIVAPMLVADLLLPPPYTIVAWAIILVVGWQFGRRRYRPKVRKDYRRKRGHRGMVGRRA
jgi:membrane protein implicated in regulation of membrane protease activity